MKPRAAGAAVVLLAAGLSSPAWAELGMGAALSWRLLEFEQVPSGNDGTRFAVSATAVGVTGQVSLDGLLGVDPEVAHAGRPGSWLRLSWFGPTALGQGAPIVSGVEVLGSVDLEESAPAWSWSLETAFAWRSFRTAGGTVDHWTPFHVGAALNFRPGGIPWFAVGARVDPVLLAALGLDIPELLVLRSGLGGTGLEGAAFARGGLSAPIGRGAELFILGEFLAQGAVEAGQVTALRSVSLQAGCTF